MMLRQGFEIIYDKIHDLTPRLNPGIPRSGSGLVGISQRRRMPTAHGTNEAQVLKEWDAC